MEDKNNQNTNPQDTPAQSKPPVAGDTFSPQSGSSPAPSGQSTTPDSQPQQTAPAQTPPSATTPPPQQTVPEVQSSGGGEKKGGSGKKVAMISGAVLLVLLLAGGAFAAYAQLIMPERVLTQYAQRLADFESGHFEATFSGEVDDEFSPMEFSVSSVGSFSASDEEDVRFDTSNDFSVSSSGAGLSMTFDFNVDARFVDDTGYLRSSDVEFMTLFLPGIEANTWYSFPIDEDEAEDGDLTCTTSDMDAISDYLADDASDRVVIQDAQRHTWLPMDRNGENVQHYSGTIEGEVLVNLLNDMAEVTSDDCLEELDAEERDDVESLSFGYDLYTGSDYDELVVEVTDREDDELDMSITLITRNYNEPVDIQAPDDAVDFEEMMENQTGMFGFEQDLDYYDGGEFESDWDFDFSEEDYDWDFESDPDFR